MGLPNPRYFSGRKPRARDTRDRGTINTQHPPHDSVQRPHSLNLDRKNVTRFSEHRSFYNFRLLERARPDRKSANDNPNDFVYPTANRLQTAQPYSYSVCFFFCFYANRLRTYESFRLRYV